jgi:cell division GTPase FtsZ
VGQYLRPDAKMVWGAVVDPGYTGHMRVMVALSGVESTFLSPKPVATAPVQAQVQVQVQAQAPQKKGFFS